MTLCNGLYGHCALIIAFVALALGQILSMVRLVIGPDIRRPDSCA